MHACAACACDAGDQRSRTSGLSSASHACTCVETAAGGGAGIRLLAAGLCNGYCDAYTTAAVRCKRSSAACSAVVAVSASQDRSPGAAPSPPLDVTTIVRGDSHGQCAQHTASDSAQLSLQHRVTTTPVSVENS